MKNNFVKGSPKIDMPSIQSWLLYDLMILDWLGYYLICPECNVNPAATYVVRYAQD